MEKEIALAGATLAGQMTLAGLILIYQGFAVSWWRSQIDSKNKVTLGPRQYSSFLVSTTISVVASLVGTIVPVLVLTRDDTYDWALPSVLVLSVALVVAVAIQGCWIFLKAASAIAPRSRTG